MHSIVSRDVLSRNNEHSLERSSIKKKALIRLSILSIFNIICCLIFLIIVGLATLFLYVYASSTILARNSKDDPLLSDVISCTVRDLSVNCTESDLEDLLVTKDKWKFSDFFDHLHYLSDDERDHLVIVDGITVSTDKLEFKLCKALVNYSSDGVSQRNEITIDEFVVSYKTDENFKPLQSGDILNIHFPGNENSTAIPAQYLMFSKIMETRSCYVNPLDKSVIGFYERTIDFYYPGRSQLTSLAGYLALGFLIASGAIFAFFVIPLTIVSIKRCYSYKSDIETMGHMEMNDQEESDSGSQVSDDINDRRYFYSSSIQSTLRKLSENEKEQVIEKLLSETGSSASLRSNKVLGFVTPWNSNGYNVAKTHEKVKLISPVWLQIRPSQQKPNSPFQITGIQDVDMNWIKQVKKQNIGAKILPRVQFDYSHWGQEQVRYFYGQPKFNKNLHQPIIDKIGQLIRAYDLDGIVVEVGFLPMDQIKHIIVDFMKSLREKVNSLNKKGEIHLVVPSLVPPTRNEQKFSALFRVEHLIEIEPYVDGFLLMTYDYFSHMSSKDTSQKYIFNGPLEGFIDQTVNYFTLSGSNTNIAQKLFVGLNFYGIQIEMENTNSLLSDLIKDSTEEATVLISKYLTPKQTKLDHILGSKLKELLNNTQTLHSIIWDSEAREHIFEFVQPDKITLVAYPTLESIKSRVDFVKEKRLAGVMIWELGQGLESLYSEL
ncbi:glycosyl hydrolase [Naegleria gruberi]|uniref:Chitinase domain-containing protein 1 n=1 Tax=Naegleria gruberi TaxID=5762 RepID=D2UZU7_NAEGR|nr:glycosyl hydrolase [Naegleria gruberi]EFC50224.1 glycosyl hydrolase [Naegleria gruberi]|eukprot:XP_002682968.1 glycosyl hydrolase [Naegleria gruberi strain NEG-M]